MSRQQVKEVFDLKKTAKSAITGEGQLLLVDEPQSSIANSGDKARRSSRVRKRVVFEEF